MNVTCYEQGFFERTVQNTKILDVGPRYQQPALATSACPKSQQVQNNRSFVHFNTVTSERTLCLHPAVADFGFDASLFSNNIKATSFKPLSVNVIIDG